MSVSNDKGSVAVLTCVLQEHDSEGNSWAHCHIEEASLKKKKKGVLILFLLAAPAAQAAV